MARSPTKAKRTQKDQVQGGWRNPTWLGQAVLVAVIPASAAIVAFAYELGFSYFFGIPPSLIELNWTLVALAVIAVAAVFQFFVSGAYLAYISTDAVAKRSPLLTPKRLLGLTPLIMLSFIFLVQHGVRSIAFLTSILLVAFIITVDILQTMISIRSLRGFWARIRTDAKSKEQRDPLSVPFNKVAITGIWIFVLLIGAWSSGFANAKKQRTFLITAGSDERVVLRQYGNTFVLAPFSRESKTVERVFYLMSVGGTPGVKFVEVDIGPLRSKSRSSRSSSSY
jgi:hypothetical protein